jgi:predicted TIM-barrel fold metal-dependent hydrolase
MAGANAREEAPHENLNEILRSAEVPNIYIKLSGFHYASHVSWAYPYSDTHYVVRKLYENFGAERLCWGSDYPVVRFNMTYQHALEAFRTHCTFVPDEHKQLILGENLGRLLDQAGA